MSRFTRHYTGESTLEDRLQRLRESPFDGGVQAMAWDGRGWLTALVAMVGALLLMLPIAWAFVATRERKKVDHSVVATITLMPMAVAAILVIVQDSLAVAFSLAGIAGLVRFRSALDDTKDAMYVFVAIAVGLGAGVGTMEAAATLSGLFNLVAARAGRCWQPFCPSATGSAIRSRWRSGSSLGMRFCMPTGPAAITTPMTAVRTSGMASCASTPPSRGCPAVWSASGSGQVQEVPNRRPQPRCLALTGDQDRHHAWIVRRQGFGHRAIVLGRRLR